MGTTKTRAKIDVDEEAFKQLMNEARPERPFDREEFYDVTQTITGSVHRVRVNYTDDSSKETLYLVRHNTDYFAPVKDIRTGIEAGIEEGKKSLQELVDKKGEDVKASYQSELDKLLQRFEQGGDADPFLASIKYHGWTYILERETTVRLRELTPIQYELAHCMKKSIGTALKNTAIGAPYLDHHWTSAGVPRNYGFHSLSPAHKK